MGILFRKLFWLLWEKIVLVIEKCFGKIEAEGREFAIVFRSLEQFDWIVKAQNNFWYRLLLTNNWNVEPYRNNLENGMVGYSKMEYTKIWIHTLQMFAGIYRDFAGKSECGDFKDFKFTGIACIPAIPVIFEVNQKKVWTFYIYSLLRFFKFPYNFCGDFRRTCNPCDNYMHFTGYVLRHGDPPHFLWGKNCSLHP